MKKENGNHFPKENRFVTLAFSILFSIHLVLGREIYNHNGIDRFLKDIPFSIISLICGICLTILLYMGIEQALFPLLALIRDHQQRKKICSKRRWFPLIWLGILAAWFPAFQAYYPGILSYDSILQTNIAMGIEANSRFHPPLHTLLWKFCIETGERLNISGLVLYGLLQMVLLSLVMAYMLYTILKEGTGMLFFCLSFIFTACNPVMAVMSLEMTKDVPFCMALTCAAIELFYMEKDPAVYFRSRWSVTRFVVFFTLAGLLRNNMIYAFILTSLLMIILRRTERKKLLAASIAVVCCIVIIDGPVYSAMGIGPGNPGEMLSVPIQQISRAVSRNKPAFSDADKEEIDLFLPFDSLDQLYNPRFADPVKGMFRSDNYSNYRGRFVKLWLSLLKRFPLDFINAFAELNIPYWYIGADAVDPYSQRIYIETQIWEIDAFPVSRISRAPKMLEYYESFASYSALKDRLFFIRLPFSLSAPIWLILVCIMIILRRNNCRDSRNKGRFLSCYLIFFFLWLTYLAGPLSNFRYIFPIYAVYPLLLHIAVFQE